MLEMNFMHWTYAGRETSRRARARRPVFPPIARMENLRPRSGRASVAKPGQANGPRVASEETSRRMSRRRTWTRSGADERVDFAVESHDLYKAAQEARIPFAPVNTNAADVRKRSLQERKYFVEFDQPGMSKLKLPGAPSQYGKIKWRCAGRRRGWASIAGSLLR